MTANVLSLVANSDCAKLVSRGFLVHGILKPIKFELGAASVLMTRRRRDCMRALYEMDFRQQRAEYLKRNLTVDRHSCVQYGCMPQGLLQTQH